MLTIMKSKYSVETIGSLQSLPAVDPDRYGGRWQPVEHHRLASTVISEAADQYGMVETVRLLLSPDKETLIGAFELPDLKLADYQPAVFFRHDNKQGRALQIGAGGKVFVCENGIASSEWTVKAKHEKGLDFGAWVREALEGVRGPLHQQEVEIWRMKEWPVDLPHQEFFRLVTEDGLPQSLAFDAEEEWRVPRHQEFSDHSKWAWYNAVTEAAKKLAPATQTRALLKAFERMSKN